MNKGTLEKDLEAAGVQLLEMVRQSCWNTVSGNCLYILTEIEEAADQNLFEKNKHRKLVNDQKKPVTLHFAAEALRALYDDLYDINLFVFRAKKNQTVVEIQYYLKSALEPEYREKVKYAPPMLHCKIEIPPYHKDHHRRFDVHWPLGGLRFRWNLFWYRRFQR